MYEKELSTALRIVQHASELCRQVQHALVEEHTLTKRDKSPVTVADFGSQALINHGLAETFPSDPIVAEEDAAGLRDGAATGLREQVIRFVHASGLDGVTDNELLDDIDRGRHPGGPEGRFWTLDPIDGTKGFIRGDQYAVALALIEEGKVVLGVLGCPNLSESGTKRSTSGGTLYYAITGAGAFMMNMHEEDRRPLRVAPTSNPADIVFCESVESGHSAHGHSSMIAKRLGVTAAPVRLDSQSKYAVVARGEAAAYLRLPTRADYREKIWDHAAGCILVEEAGGQITDVHGHPLDFSLGRKLENNAGVIATNGITHEEILTATQAVLSGED